MPYTMSQRHGLHRVVKKSAYILGRLVDFMPHHRRIDGLVPNQTAIYLAQAPTIVLWKLHKSYKQCITLYSPTHQSPRKASTTQCKLGRKSLMENLPQWYPHSTSTWANAWRWQPTHSKFKPQAPLQPWDQWLRSSTLNQHLHVIPQSLAATF